MFIFILLDTPLRNNRALLLRKTLLELHKYNHAGHIGCALSCLDILEICYFEIIEDRDTFLLSKSHAASALYTVLYHLGKISKEELFSFYQNGTKFPAHTAPAQQSIIPFATGSLGHGFSLAAGMAKAKKIKKESSKVIVLLSDGETNEGTTWEAAHFAAIHKLSNLIVIIDKNGIQGFDQTLNVLGDTAQKEKWMLFGFSVQEIDGHSTLEIYNAIQNCYSDTHQKPHLIIANTIKGKGVSFMENTIDWHYLPMTDAQYALALNELEFKYQYA
jgi:transketolase